MSRAANCGSPNPSQFHFNEVSAGFAIAFTIITSLYYIWNGISIALSRNPEGGSRPEKTDRSEVTINPLSGLLASVVGIVLIFATWPQPLEGAATLVMVLAQASVLGWQDHDPVSFWKDMFEKLPDVLAVIVAAYALGDARKKYQEATGNSFKDTHDPATEMILAYILTAVGAILGGLQEYFFTKDDIKPATQQRILRIYSIMFFILQSVIGVVTIIFGALTIPAGCAVFNAPKITAIITLALGIIYSLSIVSMRGRLEPVT